MSTLTFDDTITAISSAPGPAGRGIVRLSGPHTREIVGNLFAPEQERDAISWTSWTLLPGRIVLGEHIHIRAQLASFAAPASYTTEDMAELHMPGGPAVTQMVLQKLLQLGARLAGPGEFTARAFLNGRLDLTQAQAVAEAIHAQSDAELRWAQSILKGKLHSFCRKITDDLTEVLALIEAGIDFAEEDIELASTEQLATRLETVQQELGELLNRAAGWQQLHHLPQVVLAGVANAGKSSLANALLGMDRSLVNALAGTTRDRLTAPLTLDNGECLLIDTAGLGAVTDPLKAVAQQHSREAVEHADLVLWVIDPTQSQPEKQVQLGRETCRNMTILWVINKTDLMPQLPASLHEALHQLPGPTEHLQISAKQHRGLPTLRAKIQQSLNQDTQSPFAQAMPLTVQQKQAFQDAQTAVQSAQQGLAQTSLDELIAVDLRQALDALGHIVGAVTNERILGQIFSKFCIGK